MFVDRLFRSEPASEFKNLHVVPVVATPKPLSVRKSEILRGVFKRPVKITFGEFGKRYMEYAKANKRSWLRDEQMLKQLRSFLRERDGS